MNVPKLRFKEFNATYKTILFGDLVTNKSDKYNPLLNEQPFKCIELEHMDSNTGSLNGFTDSRLQASIKNVFNPDSVLYGKLRPYLNKFYYTNFSGVCSSEIWVLSSLDNNKLINPYLYYLIQTSKYSNLAAQSTGSKMPRADWSILSETDFEIPVIEEQKKISSFLKKIDVRIQLQQEKIDLLKEQKKGFMQKIFSRELRFKNKDGQEFPAWENKLIGEIGDIIMGQSPDGSSYSEDSSDTVLVQGNADLKNGKIVPRIYTSKITKMATIGDIILTVRAPVGVVAKCNIPACIGRGVCAIRSDDFLFYYLDYYYITSQWSKLSQGSTFESVNSNDIKNIIVPQPSTHEKEVIISFFDRLSQKIHLAEGALSELEKQKQAFMQQMFI